MLRQVVARKDVACSILGDGWRIRTDGGQMVDVTSWENLATQHTLQLRTSRTQHKNMKQPMILETASSEINGFSQKRWTSFCMALAASMDGPRLWQSGRANWCWKSLKPAMAA